ncbi:hypothetical protein LCGC14_1181430 [marine sediment metagenome]|uniref:Carbohydrate-binding/sugar hydrolysis domain-containing protein n=1 Tax=marine sediment metagenome TaxID=412755 RepID=A0A0F9P4W7_9ZZZZ
MKSDIKKRKFLVILGIIFVLLTINQYNFSKNQSNYDDNREIRDETNLKKPKSFGFWDENNVSFIHISADNWSATDLPWIQNQTGTWSDPHIIENVSIDGTGRPFGIFIENSNDFFIIRNVSVYNTGSGSNDAGISLDNTNNGVLTNNNISNNGRNGIYLINSNNNIVSGNIANNNNKKGIYLYSSSNNNTISGNTAKYNDFGIYLYSSCNNNTISGNTVTNNMYGIAVDSNSNTNTVVGNNATNNDYGIFLHSNDNNVSRNIANYNTQYGIYLSSCSSNIISGNNATNNNYGIYIYSSSNNNISANTATNNNRGIFLNWNSHYNNLLGNNANNNTQYGIYIESSNYAKLSGNTANNNVQHGIYLGSSNYDTISGNTASKNTLRGVYLSSSSNNNISGNIVSDNLGHGIFIYDNSDKNTISSNYASNNSKFGISIERNSDFNSVIENTVYLNNWAGICIIGGPGGLTSSYNNTIYRNLIQNNTDHGIDLRNYVYSTNVSRNIIKNNDWSGIALRINNVSDTIIWGNLIQKNKQFGINLNTTTVFNNLIYQNSFIGNLISQGLDSGIGNNWNNSMRGNYWDNHTSPDSENDGIVDNPYIWITGSANSEDSLPLTEGSIHYGEKIHIDGLGVNALNWSITAKLKEWCSGSGKYSDPYVIDGLEIDAGGSWIGILIENSKSDYFIIRNSKIYNSGTDFYEAGIRLDNTNKGTLTNNNLSDNGFNGIFLWYSDNNTISENTANNNDNGISLNANSNNNTISGNTASDNNLNGIYLEDSSNNTILNNIINNNIQYGIYFLSGSSDNTILNNIVNNNIQYGIYLRINCNRNNITENYLYFNSDGGIYIYSITSSDNIIERNALVSNDWKFVDDSGTNTTVILNYFSNLLPRFVEEVISQSFSTTEFVVTIKISCEVAGFEVFKLSIQAWWNRILVSSNDIEDIGNGIYNISLIPIFVEPGETPILLNMTLVAQYHNDKYYETLIAVEPEPDDVPVSVSNLLFIDIKDQRFSMEEFNITFFVYNESNDGIGSSTIQMWWNGSDVSSNVQNLGNGLYFVSLDPITVKSGEDPILLEIAISASGFENRSFDIYIAVDPDTLLGDIGKLSEEFPIVIIVTAVISIIGGIGIASVIFLLLRRRKGKIGEP